MEYTSMIKIVDTTLFLSFLFFAVSVPLLQLQAAFPSDLWPNFKPLLDFKNWYVNVCGGYLFADPPPFLVGLLRVHVVLLWPLSFANLVGSASSSGKPWYPTTALVFGVATFTSMAAVIKEMEGKAPDKLLIAHYIVMGSGALAATRGLLRNPANLDGRTKKIA